jgi:hypothetical protein
MSQADLMDDLANYITELEADSPLLEPSRMRDRLEALDRLDALCRDNDPGASRNSPIGEEIRRRAHTMRRRLESLNDEVFDSLRVEIQRGDRPNLLLRGLSYAAKTGEQERPLGGLSYDALDDLVTGILQLEEPRESPLNTLPERVFYQPTPARHIFNLIHLTRLIETDVLVDLGSGLGHVPILASIQTGAHCIGIEVEQSYVACARRCAQRLRLKRVLFIQQDARAADLSRGTIFYLYTPFAGTILDAVLGRLRAEAENRLIRICTFGPCTGIVAYASWLAATTRPDPEQITVFTSQK